MKTLKWKIELSIEVTENWIEDGCDFGSDGYKDAIQEKVKELLPYAWGEEIKVGVKVLKAPDENVIRKIQGYAVYPDNHSKR